MAQHGHVIGDALFKSKVVSRTPPGLFVETVRAAALKKATSSTAAVASKKATSLLALVVLLAASALDALRVAAEI